MASVVWEKERTNARGKSSIHTRSFKVDGATSIADCISSVRSHPDCPDSVAITNPAGGTYDLTGPEGKPEIEAVAWCPPTGVYEAKAIYTHPESRRNEKQGVILTDVGDTHYEYIFGGQTVTETFSLGSTGYNGTSSYTTNDAINDRADEGVVGVQIQRLKGGIKISKLFGPSQIDGAWISARKSIVHNKVNSDVFEYAAISEALLTELRVIQKESGNWLAEFTIETGDNQTNQTVAGIANVSFDAHDYVEARFHQVKDGTENVYRSKAFEVIVHRMHGDTTYSTLLDPA